MRLLDPVELRRLSTQPLTYAAVGATAGSQLPRGYRIVDREHTWTGTTFAAARDALLTWEIHELAGLTVEASGPVTVGAVVCLGLRLGPSRIRAACRVVALVDAPGRCAFAYGTLPGHPESGEELFEIRALGEGVAIRIRAFSRPARLSSRMAAPLARRVQDRVTDRYLSALD